jgi:hypothetical protein
MSKKETSSGHYNSGYFNTGNINSGNSNSGYRNSGDWNSGNSNSGYSNSGGYNSGSYNSGNRNSGHFNTNEPTIRLFNKDTGLKRSEIDIPYITLKLTEWDSEKQVLTTRSYKEAWTLYWTKASKEDKQRFLDLPNFDSRIFEEITGVDVEVAIKSCDGKIVEIDGKKYKLSEVE